MDWFRENCSYRIKNSGIGWVLSLNNAHGPSEIDDQPHCDYQQAGLHPGKINNKTPHVAKIWLLISR